MSDIAQLLPMTVLAGVSGFAGNVALQWLKSRGERDVVKANADVQLEQHRDKLMFDVLAATEARLAGMVIELNELRPLAAQLSYMQESISVIRALLAARTPDERKVTERSAELFLKRMARLEDARGTMRNEEQRAQSAASLPDDMRDALHKIDRED